MADWNAAAVSYLKEIREKGFQYGSFVADSKPVTHSLAEAMNEPGSRIPFVSRCPSNFEGKLAERCILRAYEKDSREEFGTFQEEKRAASYRGQCFQEEACGVPMRLLVPESPALKEKAAAALKKSPISNIPISGF